MKYSNKLVFYNCRLEPRQLLIGEDENCFLRSKEVVRTICDADFRNNSLDLIDPKTNKYYYHEYAKHPKNGLYLMRVVNERLRKDTSTSELKTDHPFLHVLIDTQVYPHFVIVEHYDSLPQCSAEVVGVLQHSLSVAVWKHGWRVVLNPDTTGVVSDFKLAQRAWEYLKNNLDGPRTLEELRGDIRINRERFHQLVISESIADGAMKWIQAFMRGKTKPKDIIAPLRAAKEAGVIKKMSKAEFRATFGGLLGNSLSLLDRYMSDTYSWNPNDKVYQNMVDKFGELVEAVIQEG